jgi:hypothetical protein
VTQEEIEQFFEDNNDDFLKFELVENPRSKRPDLHAFLLLEELVPGDKDILDAAEHDEVWLSIELSELEGKITEEQLLELIRCGIRCDEDGQLCTFV